jgi:uroporphyrinogen-III synthase
VILLTRPRAASDAVAVRLVRAGVPAAQIVVAPLMETVATDAEWSPEGYAGFVFTSAEGVRHAVATHDMRWRRAWCVGDRTAQAAAAAGMDAESAGGTVEDLVAMLARQRPPGRLLHLVGEDTRGDLAARLTQAGTDTVSVAIYRQVTVPLTPGALGRVDAAGTVIAPAYSPLSTARLAEVLGPMAGRVHLVAISPAAAAAWGAPPPARTTLADAPDGAAMDRAIRQALRVETGDASS